MRGPLGAQSGQAGFYRPKAKMERAARAGAEGICVVVVDPNRLISCISSRMSTRAWVVQDPDVNRHIAGTDAVPSV